MVRRIDLILIKTFQSYFDQFFDSGSGGQISWDQNSTFSGGQIFGHDVKIQFVHEVKFVQ